MPERPETALRTVEQTRTQTALSMTACIRDATYAIGRTCSDTFRDVKDRFICHDRVNGQWNDLVDPNGFAYWNVSLVLESLLRSSDAVDGCRM
jgi:hypothetical protein